MHKAVILSSLLLTFLGILFSGFSIPQSEAKTLAECNAAYAVCSRRCYDVPTVDRFITCNRACRADYLACGDTLPITGNLPLSKGDPAKKKQKPEATR